MGGFFGVASKRECILEDTIEYWLFEKSNELQEALDFYFYMRKKTKTSILI